MKGRSRPTATEKERGGEGLQDTLDERKKRSKESEKVDSRAA
jgi:hypothetical protein